MSAEETHDQSGLRELRPEDERLIAFFDELRKGSLGFQDEAAKRLVELITLLYGLFFAVFSFTEAPAYLRTYTDVKWLAAATLVAYFASLLCAIRVILPREYTFSSRSLSQMHENLEEMLAFKGKYLRLAYAAFGLGTLFFIAALLVSLFRL